MVDYNVDAALMGIANLDADLTAAWKVASPLAGIANLDADLTAAWKVASPLAGKANFTANFSGAVPVASVLAGRANFLTGNTPLILSLVGRAYLGATVWFPPSQMAAEQARGADSVSAGLGTAYGNNVPGPFRANTTWGTRRSYKPLAGQAVLTGTGQHLLADPPLHAGAIKIDLITGAGGGPVVALRNDYSWYGIVVSLDGSNRPQMTMQDVSGTIIAQAPIWGLAIPAGTALSITLSWNALLGTASFSVNGTPAPVWSVVPAGSWIPFPIVLAIVDFPVQEVLLSRIPI